MLRGLEIERRGEGEVVLQFLTQVRRGSVAPSHKLQGRWCKGCWSRAVLYHTGRRRGPQGYAGTRGKLHLNPRTAPFPRVLAWQLQCPTMHGGHAMPHARQAACKAHALEAPTTFSTPPLPTCRCSSSRFGRSTATAGKQRWAGGECCRGWPGTVLRVLRRAAGPCCCSVALWAWGAVGRSSSYLRSRVRNSVQARRWHASP